jgi:two-component system chemotaxis sensor kinase CheA
MSRYLDLFVSEARQHLQEAEREVSRMAAGGADAEAIQNLFRHFHSLKGMAASMGFSPIAQLSHAVEDLFDEIRKDPARPAPPGVVELVLESLDVTAALVESASRGAGEFPDQAALIARVKQAAAGMMGPAGAVLPRTGAPAEASPGPPPESGAETVAGEDRRAPSSVKVYRCRLQIDPEADMPSARAALVLRQIEPLGVVLTSTPAREALGSAPFDGVLTVLLSTPHPRENIAAALEDLLDVASYSVTEELLPSEAPRREGGLREAEAGLPSTIRIPTAALDGFLGALGEMITWRGSLGAALKARDLAGASEGHRKLGRAVDRLREEVMAIRLLPFEHIVPHLNQAVRALARQTGRKVSLQISGTEVALDRSVLEEVLDPLNHILRNAVDHGIEPPEERAAAGKDLTGRILIAVSREGDRVRIRIEDDGRGMDTEAILAAALEGGFVAPDAVAGLDAEGILMLTTIPGFSTTRTPTEISGRGVGMDVVRTRVERLGGHMRLRTARGAGTSVVLDLPLTVAVIDAFLVLAGGSVFAVPASVTDRTTLVAREAVRRTRSGFFLDMGDALVPALRPDEALGLAPQGAEMPPRFPALFFRGESQQGALAVDAILERRELVVKPLGRPLEHLREYSGAALLDDGRIALILDVPNLAEMAAAA